MAKANSKGQKTCQKFNFSVSTEAGTRKASRFQRAVRLGSSRGRVGVKKVGPLAYPVDLVPSPRGCFAFTKFPEMMPWGLEVWSKLMGWTVGSRVRKWCGRDAHVWSVFCMVLPGRKKPKVHPLVRMVPQWSLGCSPKKLEKVCFVHVASVPFTKSGALFKNLLKELCWDSAGVATSDSTDSMTLGTGR